MKNFVKNNWKFCILLFIIIIVINIISCYNLDINNKLYSKGTLLEGNSVIEDVTVGTNITGTFIALDDNLEKISLNFEPYKDIINCGGTVVITIENDEGKILKSSTITRNYIRENSTYLMKFKKQKSSKDKEYKINIYFKDLQNYDKFYTLKYNNNANSKQSKLFIDGKEIESSSLIYQDFYKSPERIAIYYGLMIPLNLLVILVSIFIYNKKDMKIENVYLMIATIICIFFLIAMPTFKSHDEYYHWLKAYEVSSGNLMTPIENNIAGSNLPEGVSKVLTSDWVHMTYKDVKEHLNVQLNPEKVSLLYPETSAVYSFVQYIPQAIGIILARLVTSNTLLITYAGRIVNMIVSILIIYFAIKIIPFGKKLLLIPAMIPIAIEGFSSLSPDALTISISFLYIAYIMYLAFNKNKYVGIKEKIILLVLSIIIALCKIVYIPLVGLILIIPKEKFKNKTNKSKIINFIVIAGIALAINLTWLAISSRYLAIFREGDSKVQVLLALKNPFKFIQLLLYTIDINANKYLLSLYGAELGWGELIQLNSLLPYILLIIYAFVALTDDELKNKFKTYQLVWIMLVTLAIIGLIFTSLYVQWTTVGSTSILGVQGRYFLPILPLVMIILGAIIKLKSFYKIEKVDKFVEISLLVLNIYTIAQIIIVHL